MAKVALTTLTVLALLVAPAYSYFLIQQNITDKSASYCGFYDLQRYKVWCTNANISAWVASNATCQDYKLCIPLEGYEYMGCANATYCSGLRASANKKGSQPLEACLVLRAAVNGTVATCDLEVQGPSLYDVPPPAPPSPPPSERPRRKWALWKTMTIIWSILGFAALLVIVVLLLRWFLRRRAQAVTTSPVTVLTDAAKLQLEQQGQQGQQGQGQGQQQPGQGLSQQPGAGAQQLLGGGGGGPADMTVAIRPVAPDGKPILAYGATHPAPAPLESLLTNNGNSRQLPPNAGDALLQAAASSRDAHNGPPMRSSPVPLPPQQGVAGGPAPPAAASGAVSAPYGAPPAGVGPGSPSVGSGGGAAAGPGPGAELGSGIPAVVTPAALVPPPAATLRNPTASLDAAASASPR